MSSKNISDFESAQKVFHSLQVTSNDCHFDKG